MRAMSLAVRVLSAPLSIAAFSLLTWAQPAKNRPERPAPRPQARLPEGCQAHRDLEYASVDSKSLKLDLYVPAHEQEQGKPLPLVVWIHGGAWRAGSKENAQALPLLGYGFAVASINYRLSQEAKFPAQIHDCKGAVRWLRANAGKYDLDPKRVGVWGSSAGGHLVALLGTSGGVKEMEGEVGGNLEQSSAVQAVCDFFGPSDFLSVIGQPSHIDRHKPDCPEAQLIGGDLAQNPDKAKAASSTTYVDKNDPPFLIVHGDQDMTVPLQQSQVLQEALTKAGADSTLHVVKGGGHGKFPNPQDVNVLVLKFFQKHLQGKTDADPAGKKQPE